MVVEDRDVPDQANRIIELRDQIGPLIDELEDLLEDHDETCIWRCFGGDYCNRRDHECQHPTHDQEVG